MKAPGGSGFQATLFGCLILLFCGLMLAVIGTGLPVYSVPYAQASEAFDAWCTPSGIVDDAAGDRYIALFGWRYALINAGIGIASGAVTAALLFCALRFATAGDPGTPWFRTPTRRWSFVAFGILTVPLLLIGCIHGLGVDLDRRYFPSCADSIGIPVGEMIEAALFVTPILILLGLLVTLGFGALPVRLDRWDSSRPLRSWTVTLLFGTVITAGIAITILSGFSSDLIAPSAVLSVYLLAATRAALLAPPRGRSA